MVVINLTHHGSPHAFNMSPDATIADLAAQIQEILHVPTDKQKLMVAKLGMLKAPFDSARPVSMAELADKKITLLGPSSSELASLQAASASVAAREAHLASARRSAPKAYTSRPRGADAAADSQYTFLSIRPLGFLPRPERSQAFLERLRDDPGIRAAMRAHKFSVGLLTEMDPLSYTESNHEGTTRILGLNRNQGEVIELRLRTDAYDGYRDYRTIRNTLCHELAHNVHGPHDRNFWDLCHQIEREVAAADWKSGGRSVGGDDAAFYEPSEEIAYDHGGWTGGEFVLGGGGGSGGPSTSQRTDATLTRREIIAKAAEERIKRQQRSQNDSDGDAPPPEAS